MANFGLDATTPLPCDNDASRLELHRYGDRILPLPQSAREHPGERPDVVGVKLLQLQTIGSWLLVKFEARALPQR